MIKAEGLTKRFDDFLAVSGVDLQVEAGEVLALLGPNGAGKTTTVRMLTSVLEPSAGRAWVAGYDVVEEAQKVRASVGVLTENHGLYNRMPAGEYLDFFGMVYGMPTDKRQHRITDLLERFGLEDVRSKKIGEFSKGMRQKLALARTLLHEPPVLLLDEPTSAMDPESARMVRDSIRRLRSDDRAVVICTHNLSEAEELADRIAIIRKGQIIAKGSPESLKRQFLGGAEYLAKTTVPINGRVLEFPDGVALTGSGEDWIRFSSEAGAATNPETLEMLLGQGIRIATLSEVQQSLEQVYLMAMQLKGPIDEAGVQPQSALEQN